MIARQYLVTSSADVTLKDRAIGRTLMADDITSQDLTGAEGFTKAAFVKLWSNRHITVENGRVTSFVDSDSDFQLTITSGDHTTKLTVTPNSSSGYWKSYAGVSGLLNALFAQQLNANLGTQDVYLLFAYVFTSANVKVEYDNTTLLDGTLTLNYPNKAYGDMVYENSPHTATFRLTLHPQTKDYTVGIDLDRSVAANGTDSRSNASTLKLSRKGSTTSTLLDATAGVNITIPDYGDKPSASTLTKLDVNLADKIRVAESSSLDTHRLMELYVTGENATEAQVTSNAANINTLFSNAGLSLYLNKSTSKAGDVKALAGKIGNYNHARFGVQFTGEDKPELVREVIDAEDLQDLKTLIGSVSGQVQVLAQLLTSVGGSDDRLGDITGNTIVQLIFSDLFGGN